MFYQHISCLNLGVPKLNFHFYKQALILGFHDLNTNNTPIERILKVETNLIIITENSFHLGRLVSSTFLAQHEISSKLKIAR